jgi:acetolactate synthase-1/3 small subunit
MHPCNSESPPATDAMLAPGRAVLRLVVRNHAGVMSHICGLFARRAFNVEGILCLPLPDDRHSVVLLLVNEDERLEQMIRQLCKLEDVRTVERRPTDFVAFTSAANYLR